MKLGSQLSQGRRGVRIFLGAALVSGALVAGAPAASAECESVWVPSYNVTIEVDRAVYRYGDKVQVQATVTRKDTGVPVSDAVFAAYTFEKRFVVGVTRTDLEGHARVHLKLRRKDMRPGPVTLHGLAYEEVADTVCGTLVEYGKQKIKGAFRVEQ